MGRKNRRKAIRYKTQFPDIVKAGSTRAAQKPEPKITPPPLAAPDVGTHCSAMQGVRDVPVNREADAHKLQLRALPGKNGKKAIAFVDHEHWFYSMWSHYGIRPNIEEWFGYISENRLLDVRFYADFSKEDIFRDLARIRRFTDTVIDTRSPNAKSEKDFTDFIILNDLYRTALRRDDIEKVILLTGDGHFSPAVSFLRTDCGMEAEVYGVKGCIHTSLRLSASILHELPGSMDYLLPCSRDILIYMHKVHIKAPWYCFYFLPLTEQVAECYGYSLQVVKDALETLIRQRYLFRDVRHIKGQKRSILMVDWDAVGRGGLTPPDVRYASASLAGTHNSAMGAVSLVDMPDDADDMGTDNADPADAFIQARMDEVNEKSSSNAASFMEYYKQTAHTETPGA